MNAITSQDLLPAAHKSVAESLNKPAPATVIRLPDQITVNFGPAEMAARAILATDLKVRNTGIRLSLGFDFNELLETNRRNGKDWYALPPMFDPRFNELNAENAFWLRGYDQRGEIVLTHAVRLYVWRGTNLKEEVETLRMLYGSTEHRADSASRGEVTAPVGADIAGRVSYSGALWIRNDFRGRGLARIIPALSRAIALTRWYPEYHVCFVSSATAAQGMGDIYGYKRQEDFVRILNLSDFERQLEFKLCWMTTDDAVAEVEQTLSDRRSVGAGLERQAGENALAVA